VIVVIKMRMKKLVHFLLFLLPVTVVAQYDFDTRYFTINSESLPKAPQFNNSFQLSKISEEANGTFLLDATPTFTATLNSLRISASNYREPVDMMNALKVSKNYSSTNLNIDPLKAGNFGFAVYSSDGSSKVKNTVYVEVRGLDLLDPCPPYGICPRCAPYRFARGY
jgi:hypothetical protein